MLALLALAVGGAMTPPKSLNQPLEGAQIPSQARSEHAWGYVRYRVVIGKDGKPLRCDVITHRTYELDEATCDGVLAQGQYSPATDASGVPVVGALYDVHGWLDNAHRGAPSPGNADLDLNVQSLPAGTSSPLNVDLALAVDEKGGVTSCQPMSDAPKGYGAAACQQVMQIGHVTPAADKAGTPLASVQRFVVSFATK